MKPILISIALILSSCQIAFQPFPPSVSKAEVEAAFKQRDENLLAVAQAINKLGEQVNPKEKVKK